MGNWKAKQLCLVSRMPGFLFHCPAHVSFVLLQNLSWPGLSRWQDDSSTEAAAVFHYSSVTEHKSTIHPRESPVTETLCLTTQQHLHFSSITRTKHPRQESNLLIFWFTGIKSSKRVLPLSSNSTKPFYDRWQKYLFQVLAQFKVARITRWHSGGVISVN